jgi:hypothetical protein
MKDPDARHVPLRLPKAKQLLNHINKTFGKRLLQRYSSLH